MHDDGLTNRQTNVILVEDIKCIMECMRIHLYVGILINERYIYIRTVDS